MSYYEEFQRKHGSRLNGKPDKLLTDKEAYMSFLEVQLERVCASMLTVQGFSDRIQDIESTQTQLSRKLHNIAEAVRLQQQVSETQKDFTKRRAAEQNGLKETIKQLSDQVSELHNSVCRITSRIAPLEEQLTDASHTNSKHLAELDRKLDTYMHDTDVKLGGMDAAALRQETALDGLQQQIHDIKQTTEEMQSRISSQLATHHSCTDKYRSVCTRLKDVQCTTEASVSGAKHEIQIMKSEFDRCRTTLKSQLKQNNDQIAVLENKLEGLHSDYKNLADNTLPSDDLKILIDANTSHCAKANTQTQLEMQELHKRVHSIAHDLDERIGEQHKFNRQTEVGKAQLDRKLFDLTKTITGVQEKLNEMPQLLEFANRQMRENYTTSSAEIESLKHQFKVFSMQQHMSNANNNTVVSRINCLREQVQVISEDMGSKYIAQRESVAQIWDSVVAHKEKLDKIAAEACVQKSTLANEDTRQSNIEAIELVSTELKQHQTQVQELIQGLSGNVLHLQKKVSYFEDEHSHHLRNLITESMSHMQNRIHAIERNLDVKFEEAMHERGKIATISQIAINTAKSLGHTLNRHVQSNAKLVSNTLRELESRTRQLLREVSEEFANHMSDSTERNIQSVKTEIEKSRQELTNRMHRFVHEASQEPITQLSTQVHSMSKQLAIHDEQIETLDTRLSCRKTKPSGRAVGRKAQ